MNNYYLYGNEEGNLKLILPDGKIIIMPPSKSEELEHVFPQVSKMPFIGTETYNTNGNAKSQFHNDTLDGRKYYFEIKFHNYRNSSDSDSGWMIFPLWGYDANKYDYLSFWVKGTNGGEKFGIKLKDTSGREVKVEAMKYIEGNKVDTRWKQVIIPLEHFLEVDKSSIDVITLYSDGELSFNYPETIYVTEFELYK
ncbi:MAG: hypothetical protein OIN88_00205 [Candidatus Methanoperedens sp.]|nr:hypothetical protein [Candidatus Methanoperedens sp.]MCZ7360640.1 hypothetical protein [Candidatus Methanoperedens sp.]HLB71673.1 carbohydrate binding domain-containing protein [Candidatus Methanoperedens sp.]